MRSTCLRTGLLISCWMAVSSSLIAQDPAANAQEIVRRAIEADQRNWALARNYTCQERVAQKSLNHQGAAKSQVIKTYDVTIYYNEPYQRLIQMNDTTGGRKLMERGAYLPPVGQPDEHQHRTTQLGAKWTVHGFPLAVRHIPSA